MLMQSPIDIEILVQCLNFTRKRPDKRYALRRGAWNEVVIAGFAELAFDCVLPLHDFKVSFQTCTIQPDSVVQSPDRRLERGIS